MNILFVCTGNISRSFLAEMLLKHEVRQRGLKGIHASSAGISACPGTPADTQMVEYLSEMGIAAEPHEASLLTKEDVDRADIIMVMEKKQLDVIKDRWPDAGDKLELLGSYIAAGPIVDDISDPYGASPYHYRLAQARITQAIEALIKRLLPDTKKVSARP